MKSIRSAWMFPAAALLLMALPINSQAKQDYCQYSERKILIFVDRTTAYDDKDREVFATGLEHIFETLNVGDEVTLHTIADEHTKSRRSFAACYPGCPKAGLLDWLLGSCRSMEARGDRAEFQRNLADVGRDMLYRRQEFAFSDIATTVAAVSESYRSKEEPVTHVYVFSDLVENSRALPWPEVLRANAVRFADALEASGFGASLEGAEIDAFGFGRSHNEDRRALTLQERESLVAFWRQVWSRLGASAVRIGERL